MSPTKTSTLCVGDRSQSPGELLVTYERPSDRFEHTISIATDASLEWILKSVSPEDLPSPALQDLHLHEGHVTAVLGTGMGSKNHWSISNEVDAAAGRLVWDIASRVRNRELPLGTTLEFAGEIADQNPQSICVLSGDLAAIIEVLDIDGQPSCRLETQGNHVILRPFADSEGNSRATTVRWRYSVRAVKPEV